MEITYNALGDTLRILFSSAPISETNRQTSGVLLDYDQHGRLVGLELAAASRHVANPYSADMVVDAGPPEGAGI